MASAPDQRIVGPVKPTPLSGNRDYVLLWSSSTVSALGSQVSTVAYPLLILSLTGSAAKAGVVGLATWLPLAVFSLPAGVVADRVDRKRLMISCDLIRLLAVASIQLASWIGSPSFLQIVIVAFLDGALFTTSFVCERGALSRVVAPDQRPDAVAQTQAREPDAILAGPPLGGLLFAAARALPLLFDAGSFLASMIGLSLTRADFQAERVARSRSWSEPVEGLRWLWQRPFFRATVLLFAGGNPYFTGLYLLAILLARRDPAGAGTRRVAGRDRRDVRDRGRGRRGGRAARGPAAGAGVGADRAVDRKLALGGWSPGAPAGSFRVPDRHGDSARGAAHPIGQRDRLGGAGGGYARRASGSGPGSRDRTIDVARMALAACGRGRVRGRGGHGHRDARTRLGTVPGAPYDIRALATRWDARLRAGRRRGLSSVRIGGTVLACWRGA